MPENDFVEALEVDQLKTRELCKEVLERSSNINSSLTRLVSSLNIDEHEREALHSAVAAYAASFESMYGALANETDAEEVEYMGKHAENLLRIAEKWTFEFTKTIKMHP